MKAIAQLRSLCLRHDLFFSKMVPPLSPATESLFRATASSSSSKNHHHCHVVCRATRSSTRCFVSSTSTGSSAGDSLSSSSTALSSKRGRDAVKLLPSYLADARGVTKYAPGTAPDGALQLGVAESLMLEDWLLPALNSRLVEKDAVPANAIYYQPTAGREDFRTTMAWYVEDLVRLPHGRIEPNNLVLGAGCNAVLENLCICLAEQGDAVLIPTPYYAAFEFDLGARAGLAVVPVTTQKYHKGSDTPSVYYPNTKALDAAYEGAKQAGTSPRILLISHPHNPLGICYPPHVVQECIDWCRSNQVHLISDEIYAGSVYRPEQANFQSVLHLADCVEGLGPYVHWVYALSKDFALSGLRVGAVYTENPEIQLPLQKLNDLCQISSTTQIWTTNMMKHKQSEDDELWVSAFRRENHRRLEDRCRQLTSVLDECNIPYLAPNSGLFVWLDLSKYVCTTNNESLSPDEKERDLYLRLVKDFGLLLTPGASMRNEQAGFFRCVFTAATDEEFALSLERFRKFAQSYY